MSQELASRHLSLGEQAMEQGAFGKAEANFRYLAQLLPDDADAHFRLGLALSAQSKLEESLKELLLATTLQPTLAAAYPVLASIYQRQGEFDKAIEASRQAIALKPNLSKPYVDIVNSKKIGPEDADLITRLKTIAKEETRSPGEQVGIQFALGKAYNDTADYEKAIAHYDAANSTAYLTAALRLNYTPALEEKAAEAVIQRFSLDFLQANRGLGSDSELPVFIVGMIRSGTTLLDAILSSHPEVASVGELTFWEEQSAPLLRAAYRGAFHPPQIASVADQYRRTLRAIGIKRKRVIDKMPVNYQHVGLIHIAFPNARFIHCRRNPVDTCLSIYTTDFGLEPPRYAFNKSNIVHAYRQYQRYMAHWKTVIPPNRITDVDYEDLVQRRQDVLPQLIEFLGLDWDEAVLHHEKNKADVVTPSRWQARQPIYTRSIERWRHYEPWLGEFTQLR